MINEKQEADKAVKIYRHNNEAQGHTGRTGHGVNAKQSSTDE